MGEKTGTISDKVGSLSMTMNYELYYDDEQFRTNNDTPDKVVREAFADLKQQATDEHEGIHDSKGFDFNDTIESPMAGYTMRVKFSSKPTTDVKKMNPRLPKDGSLDGVFSRNPDPPTMNAGMPRGIDLDMIRDMNARKRLMDMGPDEVKRLLGDTHTGDYRHLFDTETNPHAFRHGIQDSGIDEIMQLLQEINLNKSFDTAWGLMKANIPCCPDKRMVERKDGTMRCRVCGSTDRVTKSDMSDMAALVKEVHDLVQIQGAHPMEAASLVARANHPDDRKLGRTLFAEYVKMMS